MFEEANANELIVSSFSNSLDMLHTHEKAPTHQTPIRSDKAGAAILSIDYSSENIFEEPNADVNRYW